jgi:hypothetical protein
LVKRFVRGLNSNISQGYVKAVRTALAYSGHCWHVGDADVPPGQWCWIRMPDLARRKQGERYLVQTRTEHGQTLFHTMKVHGC